MPKKREYNPNSSYAERTFNWVTDQLGITTAPTYKDGYGVERNPEEARSMGERERLTKAIERTGESLMVGGLGSGLLTNPIATIGALLTGAAAGEGINYATRKATNNKYQTFGELIDPNKKVSNYFGSEKIGNFITEGANPGYLIGGYAGFRGKNFLQNIKLKIPKSPYYRATIDRAVIRDAKKAGVIRTTSSWGYPMFSKDAYVLRPKLKSDALITVKPETASTLKWVQKVGPIHQDVVYTPTIDGTLNNTPSQYFEYWTKNRILPGFTRHDF